MGKGKGKSGGKFWKVVLGIIVGIAAFLIFLYLGGAEYLQKFGQKTEEAGKKLETYEKGLKDTTEKAKETVVDTAGKAKDTVVDTTAKAKETVEKTAEKAKSAVSSDDKKK